jgi:quercetin dioxygenase-like cupin family protein
MDNEIKNIIANMPDIGMLMVSNVFFRTMTFKKAGDSSGKMHKHVYDHVNLLAQGSVELEVDGEKTVYTAPSYIFIHRDHRHRMTALEDNTIAVCIHAVRDDASGDILDQSILPEGVRSRKEFTQILRQQGIEWQRPRVKNPYDQGTAEEDDAE